MFRWQAWWYVCCAVPSAPRDFEVTLTQEDPPVATLTWRRPSQLHGELLAYRLTYGSLAADFVVADTRLLEPDKRRFTTGFLGQYNMSRSSSVLRWYQALFLIYTFMSLLAYYNVARVGFCFFLSKFCQWNLLATFSASVESYSNYVWLK